MVDETIDVRATPDGGLTLLSIPGDILELVTVEELIDKMLLFWSSSVGREILMILFDVVP